MKKNNRMIIITVTLIIFMLSFITIDVYQINSGKKEVIMNNKKVLKQDTLSMMLETQEGSGEYTVSETNTWPGEGYVFNANLSSCENGSKITWDDTKKQVLLEANTSDKCYIYLDKGANTPVTPPTPESSLFADYIKRQYSSDGVNNLYYHGDALANGAADYSYRYAGANPNNYVCFGSDAATCPADNLYRIIGVFGSQVKLLKSSTYGEYSWSGSSTRKSSDWAQSSLNTSEFNTAYIDELGTNWSSKIATATWYIGGVYTEDADSHGARHAFDYEVGIHKDSRTYNGKIALMYLSDYYYGATPTYWTYPGYHSGGQHYLNAADNNWIEAGLDEYFLTPVADDTDTIYIFFHHSTNNTGLGSSQVTIAKDVRPSFYLVDTVEYASGNGTSANPYRIK